MREDASARSTAPCCRRHGRDLPDYRPCEDALTRVEHRTRRARACPSTLDPHDGSLLAAIVPGIGYGCFATWLEPPGTAAAHVSKFGYDLIWHQRRCTVRHRNQCAPDSRRDPGHADGSGFATPCAGRILERYAGHPRGRGRYPEIHDRVAAVVSIAGAVGGSALANDAKQCQADLLRHWPDANCDAGDGGRRGQPASGDSQGLAGAEPAAVQCTLLLAGDLAAIPSASRGSSGGATRSLARSTGATTARSSTTTQIVPGSTLLGFLNADHWAVAVPLNRSHAIIGTSFADKNDYPREALLEALLRFVEEDLEHSPPR